MRTHLPLKGNHVPPQGVRGFKKQDMQTLMPISTQAWKIKKAACKVLRVWTKNEEILGNLSKNFESFDKISMEN